VSQPARWRADHLEVLQPALRSESNACARSSTTTGSATRTMTRFSRHEPDRGRNDRTAPAPTAHTRSRLGASLQTVPPTALMREGPMVRIHLPPADSPSLARIRFRRSRTPAFRAGVRGWLGDRVSRDAPGFPLRANRRQCLCRAIFQYRSAADAVSGNATTVRTKSGVSGL